MSNVKILEENVIGTKIDRENNSKNFWSVNGKSYMYGYALSKCSDRGYIDLSYLPPNTELKGNIIQITAPCTDGEGELEYYTEIAFQPHDNQFTLREACENFVNHYNEIFPESPKNVENYLKESIKSLDALDAFKAKYNI